jgi:VanZ family protein
MRVRRIRRLDPWLPPLLLMAVIFFLSAQPSLDTGLGLLDTIGRKLAHFAEFGVLALLWWRALRTHMPDERAIAGAFALAAAYAATDEYHQGFVEGRTASPLDWAIDAAGAATMALALRARASVRVRR